MLNKYKFLIFNLVFFTVFGLIFIIGYLRPIPDAETQNGLETATYQSHHSGCIRCP